MKDTERKDLILIAEDSAYMRRYLTDLLLEKYDVKVAGDGKEAFQLATELCPSLILSDLIMPVADGFELLKMVRSHEKIAHIPFIFITSLTDEKSIIKGLEAGADDYLTKPVRYQELMVRIKTHLELYHFRRKALLDALEAEKAGNRKKDEFIEIASHELKTPLTCLNGYLQLLDDPELTDNELKQLYIKKSRDHLKVMTNLVHYLTNITKIRAEQALKDFTRIDIFEFIEDEVKKIQDTYTSHKIMVKGNKGLTVEADKHRLEQVLVNYISNAVKYSPEAELVDIVVKDNGSGYAEVLVKDYGIGIEKDKVNNLFTRFYRVDPINSSGFGLGLYLSSEIIKKHGGRTWAESTFGAGSKFYFKIPLVKPLA